MGQAPGLSTRSSVFAEEYLTRYVDDGGAGKAGMSAPSQSTKINPKLSNMLHQRHHAKTHLCCDLPLTLSDDGIKNSSTGKPINTDFVSLTDVNGEGVECREVLRAICWVSPPSISREDGVITRESLESLEVDHGRDDAVALDRAAPAELEVPPDFDSTGYDWSASSSTQRRPTASQQTKLESAMRRFIRSMMTGVIVQLRLEPGEIPVQGQPVSQSLKSVISVNEDFSVLCIAAGSSQRSVPLSAIRYVRPPEECKDQDRCVDLRLAGGRFVRFQFRTPEQANFFGTCTRLLVKAARTDPTGLASAPRAA